jgi:hypothetical protein
MKSRLIFVLRGLRLHAPLPCETLRDRHPGPLSIFGLF